MSCLMFPLHTNGEVLYKTSNGTYESVGCDCIIIPLDTIPFDKKEDFYWKLTELVKSISGIKL